MAFNRDVFRTRTLTAGLFAGVMVAGLFGNHWSFFLLFSVIHFGCWYEYHRLFRTIDPVYGQLPAVFRFLLMLAGWSLMLYVADGRYRLWGMPLRSVGGVTGLAAIGLIAVIALRVAQRFSLRAVGYALLAILYLSLPWSLLVDLYQQEQLLVGQQVYPVSGKWMVALLIGSIWINDTLAYLVGSLFGKTPLSKVSPKKTWEGTAGGILLSTVITASLFLLSSGLRPYAVPAVGVTFIAALMGTLGDLVESKLKRMAGVKDSGRFMPGHGGFLDRFDSLLFAIPFVWLLITLLFQ